jgi:hypothetical protein
MCFPQGKLGYKPKPTYPFLDKCHHRSTQLSHKGIRSRECFRKLQTSTLPFSEGEILCHTKTVTEVLKLHLGKGFGKNIDTMLICRKVLHQYFLPFHHVSDVMVLDLNVF